MRFFEKTLFFLRKINYVQGSGGPSGEQKSIKNRSENEVKIGTPSRLHFVWISMDLGSQVGAKLGGKIEPRQAKTKEDKGSEGKGRERKRKGRDWKGKVWKSVPVVLCGRGGEGFARPLGGHLSLGPGRSGPARP